MTASATPTGTIEHLLAAASRGDLGAFVDLCEAVAPRVYGLAQAWRVGPSPLTVS